ncbi:hypothetical protein [Streptomyces sp. NPDC003943]
MADDVLGEDRDVALGGLQVEVPEEGGADVDRQTAIDDVGGGEPAEVVRGELRAADGGALPSACPGADMTGRSPRLHRGRVSSMSAAPVTGVRSG